MMKSFLLRTLMLSAVFGSGVAHADVLAEMAGRTVSYKLVKTVKGNCARTLTANVERFARYSYSLSIQELEMMTTEGRDGKGLVSVAFGSAYAPTGYGEGVFYVNDGSANIGPTVALAWSKGGQGLYVEAGNLSWFGMIGADGRLIPKLNTACYYAAQSKGK